MRRLTSLRLHGLVTAACLAVLLALWPALARAVPTTVPYVGWLTDDAGVPLDTTIEVTAALYDRETGGAALWTHTWPAVEARGGLLTLLLGGDGSTPLDSGTLQPVEGGPAGGLYLSLSLDGVLLEPRQRLLSVPYALVAADAQRLGGSPATDYLRADEVAAVATSGAFADLEDLPAGLADGDDDSLAQVSCATGRLLQRTAEGWGCVDIGDLGGDSLAGFSCQPGQTVKWTGALWDCADDLAPTQADVLDWVADAGYARHAELADVATSGSYADLSDTPDLSGYAGADVYAEVDALRAELWCLRNCTATNIGECAALACDTVALVCSSPGPLPDGTPCYGGVGRCTGGSCCVPSTCHQLGIPCGTSDDGCGGQLSCGAYRSCEAAGRACGVFDDGCGTPLDCGTCGGGYGCDGAGQCTWIGLTCGATACPELPGYFVTCNGKGMCEYVNADPTGWRAHDAWILVPPGTFPMGAPESEAHSQARERPVHDVTFARGFLFGKYEVTAGVYVACRAERPDLCPNPVRQPGYVPNTALAGRATHPANLLWSGDADGVCAWLGGRRPSEAEWEYAATGPTHHVYPWGDSPGASCTEGTAVTGLGGCPGGDTQPVGQYPAGAAWCGALDMLGNVLEWTADEGHDTYDGAPADGSAWVGGASWPGFVVRGAAYTYYGPEGVRVAARQAYPDSQATYAFGARCARDLPLP
jgi:formylglycine-generating enzyme required for sulfatase activity